MTFLRESIESSSAASPCIHSTATDPAEVFTDEVPALSLQRQCWHLQSVNLGAAGSQCNADGENDKP
ncbi:MAG: hypothetical protein ABF507_04655, partial [Bifidobacterium aquikefiri]|uniref:hypothetical protein n=1 Tax=Bifidobacterium aquikefiri TaxID=1653207 RepID=UPI0039E8772A